MIKEYQCIMIQEKIDRINVLARKAKTEEGLTEAEKAEQAALRAEYIAEFRASFAVQLDNTVIQRPDGTKEKLKKSDK
jgi:uncharacterized protein YnzC (UPF0291/DUF896 family)